VLKKRTVFHLHKRHDSHTAPHNFTQKIWEIVLAFLDQHDSSQPFTRLGAHGLPSGTEPEANITGEGGAEKKPL
jgi:hypothetical protein